MSFPSIKNSITKRVLIEWDTESDTPCYLGKMEQGLEMTVRLNTELDSNLTLWFSLPIKVKANRHSSNHRPKVLFFVIQADMFDYTNQELSLSVQPLSSFEPSHPAKSALRAAKLGSEKMIARIRFKLCSYGKVFMPKTTQRLFLPSENVSDTLYALRNLSQAKDFYVYIALDGDSPLSINGHENEQYQLLRCLCEKVSAGEMKNDIINFTKIIEHHKNGMVCNEWTAFALDEKLDGQEQQERSSANTGSYGQKLPAQDTNTSMRPLPDGPPPKYTNVSAAKTIDTEVALSPANTVSANVSCRQDNLETEEEEEEDDDDLDRKPSMKRRRLANFDVINPTSDSTKCPRLNLPKKVRFEESSNNSNASSVSCYRRVAPTSLLALRSGLYEEFQDLILWLRKIDPQIEEANEDYLFELGRMWIAVQAELSKAHRIYIHDRSDLWRSEHYIRSPSSENIVSEHEKLPVAANVQQPHIALGPLYGGIFIREFIARNLKDIKGIMLIDVNIERTYAGLKASWNDIFAISWNLTYFATTGLDEDNNLPPDEWKTIEDEVVKEDNSSSAERQ